MNARTAVMVIGNFDGVHTGHQAVIAEARAHAMSTGLVLQALTFDPHPASVLGDRQIPKLCTLGRRLELLQSAGADEVVVMSFTTSFAQTSPAEFARILAGHGVAYVVVGENFRFGKDRVGDVAMLADLGASLGFEVHSTQLFGASDAPVSSSRIRACLQERDVARAHQMLGRPHRIGGLVVHGDARGRTMGFPTANLDAVAEMLPGLGVYAAHARLQDGRQLDAVLNIGVRPTVGGQELRIEAHLLDVELDLYGQSLSFDLVASLRSEKRFHSLDALRTQIAQDVQSARMCLRVGA